MSEPSEYELFLRRVLPVAVGLRDSQARVDWRTLQRLVAESSDESDVPVNRFEAHYELAQFSESGFDVSGSLSLTVAAANGGAEEPFLSVSCEFVATFQGSRPEEVNLARRFAESEARLLLW